MSSTNRGAKRQAFDYYATPVKDIEEFLKEWTTDQPDALRAIRGSILDPCAGGNTAPVDWEYKPGKHQTVQPTKMAYPRALRRTFGKDLRITTNDIRPDSPAEYHEDFIGLKDRPWARPDLIITNPPFSLAMAIIRRSLRMVQPHGYVVMLLRLNFFGSDKRFAFFQRMMPVRAYVHHHRMCFNRDDGRTDSVEYMHAIWQKSERPVQQTILRVI